MKKAFNLKKFSKYVLSFIGYFLLSVLDGKYSPFPLALLIANLYVGLKPLPSFILYALVFIPSFSLISFGVGVFAGAIICITFAFYAKARKKPSFEICLFSCLALAPYCYLSLSHSLPIKLIICSAIILSSFIMTSGAKIWLIKGLKYRLSTNDFCSAVFLYVFLAFGVIIAFGEGFYFIVSIFLILITSLFIKGYSPLLIGVIASLPTAIFRLDFSPIAVFAIYSLAISLASSYSKLFTVFLCATVTSCLYFFTNYFSSMLPFVPFASLIPCVIYLFFPQSLCQKWTETLKVHRIDNVSKYSINAHRNFLSGKLFELSAVFDEMKFSIEKLKDVSPPPKEKFILAVADEILISVCSRCASCTKCRKKLFPSENELEKIAELGLAKGSLNLVDLPKSFSTNCDHQEDVILYANKLIKKYSSSLEENLALLESRELIAKQTEGLSIALKELATSLCKRLETDSKTEDKIKNNLLRCGIAVKEICYFVGNEEDELIIVLQKQHLSNPLFLKAIEEIMGYKSVISQHDRISQELSAVTIKQAPSYDAMFGIANKVKFDKQKSGDTHSIIKLTEGKFLIALNDGMGSGERAEEISATAISLIESFYKAGLKSQTVLPIVNKLLAFGEEDNFTALDVAIVDLFSISADFVKIGSPYSFIITKDTVKIIEGNSLPLGILEEMTPTVCKTELNSGDVIVFVSDGITDAFESSADLIDFLSSQRALNPKTLADNILERALYLSEGVAKDDMTVFCVRIFKKTT